MALVVNTNVPSIASQRFLMESRREMETAMERLSSGLRINTAGDDAAGLAISQRMESQITGLNMAIRNANDAISLTQTAEGAMSEVSDMLQRMRELSLQSVNGVNNDADRASLDAEVQALKSEIDRIASTTTFNNQTILDGSFSRSFQIGYNNNETFALNLNSVSSTNLGLINAGSDSSDAEAPYLIGQRVSLGTATSVGDIIIDGQDVGAIAATDDIKDVVDTINESVDTVEASAFNTIVAKEAGSGIVSENEVAIRVGAIGEFGDSDYQAAKIVQLGASNSMDELVSNVNAAFGNGEVVASKTAEGKLVLSNTTGATISIVDESGTDLAYDGGTGFLSDSDAVGGTNGTTAAGASGSIAFASGTVAAGFIKLTSSDGTQITLDTGNKASSSPGAVADLNGLGFQKIIEDPTGNANQVIGAELTAVTTALSKSTAGVADLIINGVEIYDDTLSPASNTFQGKLDLINAFSDDTGVVASAYFQKTYDLSDVVWIADNVIEVNGVDVAIGSSAADFASNLNATSVANTTGLTATVNGNNLTLTGEGVQNLNLKSREYNLATASTDTVATNAVPSSLNTASMTSTVTIGATAVTAGRVFQLSLGVAAAGSLFAAAQSFQFTVTAAHSATDVAAGFVDLMHLAAISAGGATTQDLSLFVNNAAGVISFGAAAQFGSASMTITAVDLTGDYAVFALSAGQSANAYAGIRLASYDNERITIELGEGDDATAHGFKELNVGDTTYDANSPTHNVLVSADSPVSGLSVATSSAATSAISVIDAALESVAQYRANLGAVENRMTHTIDNLSNVVENTSAAQSRIRDADFAAEAAALARAQILQQAGTAMLAQANAAPQNVLSLLG